MCVILLVVYEELKMCVFFEWCYFIVCWIVDDRNLYCVEILIIIFIMNFFCFDIFLWVLIIDVIEKNNMFVSFRYILYMYVRIIIFYNIEYVRLEFIEYFINCYLCWCYLYIFFFNFMLNILFWNM